MKIGLAFGAVVMMFAGVLQQTPPRDAQALAPRTGHAAISGRVVSAGNDPVPIRRATVTVTDRLGLASPRAAVTGDDGAFVIDGLPAGQYWIVAAKAAYLPSAFGAS